MEIELPLEEIVKILAAVVVGGLIGAEREYRDKAAGFRTMIFICVGAALFTILSRLLTWGDDPTRIAANIVSGVGFLGAGVILRGSGGVVGLTTAATIWLTAALGMGLGGGQYILVGIATLAVLGVLWVFPFVEKAIDQMHDSTVYEIVSSVRQDMDRDIEKQFRQCGLRVRRLGREKRDGNKMVSRWRAYGGPKKHEQLVQKLFENNDVEEFRA